jgi:isopenicillin N synthase-like dioxygenase
MAATGLPPIENDLSNAKIDLGKPENDRPHAVSVALRDLREGNVSLETLEEAFGPASLGIILVKDLPVEYAEMRTRLLGMSSYLANLGEEELNKLEKPQANYGLGWSCGKETLADGRYDTLKGSFYANPIHNDELQKKARELYPDFPEFTGENVWPDEAILPGFRKTFEQLCHLIVDVAALVAASCDRYGVAKLEDYQPGTLENIVRSSVSTKARLLHYFPSPPTTPQQLNTSDGQASNSTPDDNWCATHRDLGALTGLTAQIFIDEAASPPHLPTSASSSNTLPSLKSLPSHPTDPAAGLYILDRAGRTTKVDIPPDALAFQTGEALEIITRGKFRAVPHFVRGAAPTQKGGSGEKVARNTLAVFTQPNLWEKIEEGRDFAGLAREVLGRGL